jgi:hypothetical protein
MMKKDYIASGLGRALTDMFYYRKTIFEVLFSRFPYKVVNLCRLAASNSEIKAGLIKCLGMRNVAGRCLLDVVAEKVPNAFKVLCRMAEKDDEIFQVLVKTGVPVQVIQNVLNEEIRRELCKQGKLLMPISDSLCVSKRERPDGISVEEGLPKKIPCFSSSGVKIMVNLGDEKTGSLGDIRAKHYDESLNCLEGIGGAYDSEGVSDLVF